MILTLDPGKRACGTGLFDPGTRELWRGNWIRAPDTRAEGPAAWQLLAELVAESVRGMGHVTHVVFEQPGAYRVDLPSRTLALQDLVAVAAWVCALFPEAVHTRLRPREWKGTIKPEIACQRAWDALSEAEQGRVRLPAPSYQHNVKDAIGIGLYILGRRGVAMVKPGVDRRTHSCPKNEQKDPQATASTPEGSSS